MIRTPCAAIIIENRQEEILLLLRDDKPSISFPNYWTLVGGSVEEGETQESAAHREMLEEIGIDTVINFWKRYDRQHPCVLVDQMIYLANIDSPCGALTLREGQDVRFFNFNEINNQNIGFEFGTLLEEYFSSRRTD